ncbi:MAG TPA: DUF3570 domain-containing protein, partial [Candidatus Polarisedimenticolia bacterium]|nr:DUF3570 domain-containing protein [Candidatus Polarisedimenticolia bacterium]
MQLETTPRTKYVLGRLKAAACMLLASGAPAIAQTADAPPTKQLDVTGLVYSERVSVVEPTVRFTRLFPNGQSFFGQLVIDSITGASPRGSLPSGQTQTVTSASGNVTTLSAGEIPMRKFMDTRLALDGEWLRSFKSFTPTIGGHFSREKDYQSLGINGKTAFDFDHRLTTLT